MVNLTSFVYFVVVQMVMISSKPVIHFSHAQFLPFVIRQDTGSIFMSNIKCSTVTTRRKMYHLRYHLSNFSWLHQVVCWESKASNKLTHHSLQLNKWLELNIHSQDYYFLLHYWFENLAFTESFSWLFLSHFVFMIIGVKNE